MKVLGGLAASAGKYRGTARVVHSVDELDGLVDGEVLVVRASSPTWTVGMLKSGAIVTELGGPICHAALVARELGLPAVVAVEDVTQIVRTGLDVTVDGTEGTISFHNSDG
jgi:phosphoenolpyruvate synthase/pyruvate phosphate dikinase